MNQIPLQAVANQSLTVTADGVRYTLTFKECAGIMCADVETDDGGLLVQGARVVAGRPIIPYAYLAPFGNFAIVTEGDALPYYDQFGVTQFLVYASADEIAGA